MIRTLLLISTLVSTITSSNPFTNFPVSGACQARCLKEYGMLKEKTTSRGTLYKEFDITNNTDFSLCKLGCTSPSFNELPLPAFKYGQESHFSVLELPQGIQVKGKVVEDVSLLCIQSSGNGFSNETLSLIYMYGRAFLRPTMDVEHQPIVHFVEVVAHDETRPRTEENSGMVVIFSDWCYTSTCPLSLSLALSLQQDQNIALQLRISSFNANGNIGGVVVSQWYSLDALLQHRHAELDVVDTRWLDDKAAVELTYAPDGSTSSVPVCLMNIAFRNSIQSHYREQSWNMDFTRGVLLRNLDFATTYAIKVGLSNFTAHSFRESELVASASLEVPACMTLVNDPSMCAPSPVTHLWSAWNVTAKQNILALSWAYTALEEHEQGGRPITMSHFIVSLQPLVTPNNGQCQHLEPIRRDITWTHRRVIFHVTDSKCNFEAEVIAVDMKKRHSSSKKIQITRSDDPTSMLLRAETWSTPLGVVIIAATAAVIGLIIGVVGCRLKENRQNRKRKGTHLCDLDPNRVVYAFSQVDNAGHKTVVGTRYLTPPGSDRTTSTNASDPAWIFGSMKDTLTLRALDNSHWNHNSTIAMLNGRIGNNTLKYNYEPTKAVDDENCYETIADYGVQSELSDEDDFSYHRYHDSNDRSSAYETLDKQVILHKIASSVEFGKMSSIPLDRLMRPKVEPAIESQNWNLIKVVDRKNEQLFAMKYARDAANIEALRREIQILNGLQHTECFYHDNIVRLLGVASHPSITPVEGYEIRGVLFEPVRGGHLRRFIQKVGTALRRLSSSGTDVPVPLAHSTPIQPTAKLSTLQRRKILSSPPSSGYDGSNRGSGATTPEGTLERIASNMASRFCNFGEEISSALAYLHTRNVIHTHVTTLNIYLVSEYSDPLDVPCDQSVKLGDFGWADSAGIDSNIVVESVIAPPEVLAGKCYDSKGDVYQFGKCLAEMANLGSTCILTKACATSDIEKFNVTESAHFLVEVATKCLAIRNRISASEAERMFKSFKTSRIDNQQADLEHINQSVLV